MGQQQMIKRTLGQRRDVPEPESTVELSRAMRADQARRATQSAARVEQARAAGQSETMRYWIREYRRATMQCRLLGERIRGKGTDSAQGPGDDAGSPEDPATAVPPVARLRPRSAAWIPPAGEAA